MPPTAGDIDFDVLVAGGGSGGFGAALAAARLGARVLLVEAAPSLGGTSVHSGVSVWEPGCGGTGIPLDLYARLKKTPQSVGIYSFARHCCWPDEGFYPGAELLLDRKATYSDTLCRYAAGPLEMTLAEHRPLIRRRWHGVPYEPAALAGAMRAMLDETGRVVVLTGTGVAGLCASEGRVNGVQLRGGERVTARTYIDATGDGVLAGMAGCELLRGQDPRSRFGEPSAPETPTDRVNGVSLVFRAMPKAHPGVDAVPDDVPDECWSRSGFPVASVVEYPAGGLNVNMLPTMEGAEYLKMGPSAAYGECLPRVRAFWRHWQRGFPEWQQLQIAWIAPALGVRETSRVWAEYMLTQLDLEAGLPGQEHPDIIAIADHSMDLHGAHAGSAQRRNIQTAYGVPFRCLIPRGTSNLLVACRAAGFSSLAASGCRLQRTMMALGQAAGTAAALAAQTGMDARDVPAETLRESLRRQGVQLQWPLTPELQARVRAV